MMRDGPYITAKQNRVRLKALAMLEDGERVADICAACHISTQMLSRWTDAEAQKKKPKDKKNLTPAPYYSGLAGWGRWR